MINRIIKFFIQNKIVAFILLLLFLSWGIYHAPYDIGRDIFPNDAVSVDAIPDIGENQQIVYTEWPGQSPQDIEDQITYPLTSTLLGIPGVKTVRGSSMFGFSSIYVIFEEGIDYYWSRNRILEKINSLPSGLLPPSIRPALGPDATAMGQIFWYTLEGRDEDGKTTGGWDLHEVRTVQDFYVKNALMATSGISEVASIGGFVKEYQIDLNPELMRQFNISLDQIVRAIRESNKDAGARTLEINNIEYFIRGLGFLESLEDIENIHLASSEFTPIQIKDVAMVTFGPADRRGILDKGGAEVVGGVAIAQFGANPMEVIENLKVKIEQLSPGMPSKILDDGRLSTLTIIPFYDRSVLIKETLNTLGNTLGFEILITMLVVIVMLFKIRVSFIISGLMPIVVLMVFIAMKYFNVDANIVALSGIAIAIGTLVDMGIILTENMVRHLQMDTTRSTDEAIYEATKEVSGAVLTAGLTTIISFIPVFSLTGAEGKLFTPLAFTKTVALTASVLAALFLIPPIAAVILREEGTSRQISKYGNIILVLLGCAIFIGWHWLGVALLFFGIIGLISNYGILSKTESRKINLLLSVLLILVFLGYYWNPMGLEYGIVSNLGFVVVLVALVLGIMYIFRKYYSTILDWALANKIRFLSIPAVLVILGFLVMINTQKEFMPSLDEGSYLLMPTSMPHAGVTENGLVLKQLDMAVASLPEVNMVVGKAGRVESALDPAPLSMYENLILYKPEYMLDKNGEAVKFQVDEQGLFRTADGKWIEEGTAVEFGDLVQDKKGSYYRNWRQHIHSRDDIWREIVSISELPGVTSAPKLQPIETRLVMLQTGMRAPLGIKIKGPEISKIEEFGLEIESIIKNIAGIKAKSVFADRIVGKPYLEIDIDRDRAALYGLSVQRIQELIEVAIGGKILSKTVEGRESYNIRIRYPRELRGSPKDLENIYINIDKDTAIPLSEVASIDYRSGPQNIKSEDSFLVGYVIFDKEESISEITAVNLVSEKLKTAIANGELIVPPGIIYEFSGTFQNQLRAEKKLSLVIPLVLIVIFLVLYLQFRSAWVSFMVFSGIAVSFAGGFLLIWLYNQPWFMDISMLGIDLRELFQIEAVNLSVAVWVGFIALFGIATDDGVVMATYLKLSFRKNQPRSVSDIRHAVKEAGNKRIRPCLMTTATTILALMPILTSTGRGSDVMIPMAIPCLGGMIMALLTLFVVPVLYSWHKEIILNKEYR